MKNFLLRTIQRLAIFIAGALVLWFIVTHIYLRLEQRLPIFAALIITYIFSAYLLLPKLIRIIRYIIRRKYIPRTTHAADGIAADPVNIILLGSFDDLQNAFKKIGWHAADPLTIKTGWRMIVHFIRNTPYPTAPFSSLFLFGRKQDLGFEKPFGNSPRKRDHVRFWAAMENPVTSMTDINYWITKEEVDVQKAEIWVGAATLDKGFGLTALTYEITHRIDKYIDPERDYILFLLEEAGLIHGYEYIDAGKTIAGKYITDGKIACAKLVSKMKN